MIRIHGQVLFRPFDQEGLRVHCLDLVVDMDATFTCLFVRINNLVPLKALVDQFVSEGVLVPDISWSYVSPLVIVHRKEGGIRMVDCREVYQFQRISANQLPYQDMHSKHLAGQVHFAKVDSLWGYHRLKLEEESSRVMEIITPRDVQRFLSFSLNFDGTGRISRHVAHRELEGLNLNGSIVYIDVHCSLQVL